MSNQVPCAFHYQPENPSILPVFHTRLFLGCLLEGLVNKGREQTWTVKSHSWLMLPTPLGKRQPTASCPEDTWPHLHNHFCHCCPLFLSCLFSPTPPPPFHPLSRLASSPTCWSPVLLALDDSGESGWNESADYSILPMGKMQRVELSGTVAVFSCYRTRLKLGMCVAKGLNYHLGAFSHFRHITTAVTD